VSELPLDRFVLDDPRGLRELLARARGLASQHSLTSVLVGIAGFEGDPVFSEVVDFVESALRVDDSVFRMTRDRVVLLLTDVDEAGARHVIGRILDDFREHFPGPVDPTLSLGFFEVSERSGEVTAKDVLPGLFTVALPCH
jgi:GGDEF domain-containing protein